MLAEWVVGMGRQGIGPAQFEGEAGELDGVEHSGDLDKGELWRACEDILVDLDERAPNGGGAPEMGDFPARYVAG